jgi:uncharacterized phage-associated protein
VNPPPHSLSPIRNQPPYDARQVANLVLDTCGELEAEITNLKLLKILYFSYGWYLAAYQRKLFHNPIEAWEHGPVVRSVWQEFRAAGKASIKGRASYLELQTGLRRQAPTSLADTDAAFIRAETREHLAASAWELSSQTHEVGTAWHYVWHSSGTSANIGMRISDELISREFTARGGAAIL